MSETRYSINIMTIKRIVRNQSQYNMACSSWYRETMKQLIALWNEDKKCYQVMASFLEYGRREFVVYLEISASDITYGCNCNVISEATGCAHVGLALRQMMDVQSVIGDIYVMSAEGIDEGVRCWRSRFGIQKCTENLFQNMQRIRLKHWAERASLRSKAILEGRKKELLPLPLSKPKKGKISLLMEVFIPQDKVLKSEGVHFLIQFKIQETRAYVVRNISDFLLRIENGSFFEYGKQLAFEHKIENFDESSRKIIDMLKIMDAQYLELTYDCRKACVTDNHLDVFFDTVNELKEQLNLPIFLSEKPLKCELEVKTYDVSDAVYYGITSKRTKLISTAEYQYRIKGNTLTRYTCENHTDLMDLIELCERELVLSETQLKEFYELYLEPLKDNLKIKGMNVELALPEKEKFNFYCDLNDRGQMTILTIASSSHAEHELFDSSWTDKSFHIIKMEHLIKSLGEVNEHTHEILIDEHEIFEVMQDILPQLHEFGKVYISDRLKRFSNIKTVNLSAGVRIEAGLLHVNFSTDGLDSEEIEQLMNAYRRKKRFYLLKDGTAVDLENSAGLEEFEKMNRQLHLEDTQKSFGEYVMDSSIALRFESMQHQFEHIKLERDETFKKLIHQFQHEQNEPMDEKYNSILLLFPFQLSCFVT